MLGIIEDMHGAYEAKSQNKSPKLHPQGSAYKSLFPFVDSAMESILCDTAVLGLRDSL